MTRKVSHAKTNTKKISTNSLSKKLLFLLVITSMVTSMSMAKFQSTYSPSGKAFIANWSIKINTEDITNGGTTTNKEINLIPEKSENVVDGKLAPGYGGYFDITFDPTGTDVSFEYTLDLDISKLPTDITITEYDIIKNSNNVETDKTIINNKIEGEFKLSENSSFSNEDIETIRIYWVWNDIRQNDEIHTNTAIENGVYSVGVDVSITQKID